jgi:hypothetical protein
MPAFGQGFFANTRAARARLRRPIPSRVQQDHLASSLFRFDAQDIDKRPGGRIQDRPVETGLLFDVLTGIVDRSLGGGGHIADRQFLGDDQTMPANQLGRYRVDVVLAPVGNLPVALGEGPTRLSGSPRSLALQRVGQLTLLNPQRLLFAVQQSIVGEGAVLSRAISEGRKRLDTPIEPRFKVSTFPVRLARAPCRQ